jgi:serine/threonine-protein kinase
MAEDSLEQIRPGQLIADRYRIEAPIGHGAMGSVWRGVHVHLDSPVAIKLLKSGIADDPEMLERFLREAKSAAAVRSSHVVQIFDYGVDAELPFIAMELLVGEPLDARLKARGLLEPPELDKIFTEIARAVQNAHDLGVVHRDIKPANIFIAREGDHEVTKVLDFGIAKLVDDRLTAPVGTGTHTGNILGTPSYMSPEQARGQRRVDHRADLWSLAVLAFECLTGRHPFDSTTLGDLVVKICTAQPLLPSEVAKVPVTFDAWFLRGVSKKPEERFSSATEMADELHALLGAEGLAAESRPRSSSAHKPPPTERLSITTRKGPSSPPPRPALDAELAATTPRPERAPNTPASARLDVASNPSPEAAQSPRPGSAPFTQTSAEPALSTHGAISTEVLQPTLHGGRRARHIALAALLLVGAGWGVALGPARSLFTHPPAPASTATAPNPAPAAPPSVPAPEAPAPKTTDVPAPHAGAPEPAPAPRAGSGKPTPAARPSRTSARKPRSKTSGSVAPESAPKSVPPATPATSAPIDPYADRL